MTAPSAQAKPWRIFNRCAGARGRRQPSLIQENARRVDAGTLEALVATEAGRHIRRAGLDFTAGRTVLEAGRALDAGALSLAAAANCPSLPVHGQPAVAILATGDELVEPGMPPGPDQIVSSNNVGVAEIVRRAGGHPVDLGIARDSEAEIGAAIGAPATNGAENHRSPSAALRSATMTSSTRP